MALDQPCPLGVVLKNHPFNTHKKHFLSSSINVMLYLSLLAVTFNIKKMSVLYREITPTNTIEINNNLIKQIYILDTRIICEYILMCINFSFHTSVVSELKILFVWVLICISQTNVSELKIIFLWFLICISQTDVGEHKIIFVWIIICHSQTDQGSNWNNRECLSIEVFKFYLTILIFSHCLGTSVLVMSTWVIQ